MKDYEVWQMISKHLAKEDSEEEKQVFTTWLQENESNQHYFTKLKKVWDSDSVEEEKITDIPILSFWKKLTIPNTIDFITKQALGNIIGLSVGVWVSSTFTHKVIERKSWHNLFGLTHRKTTVVNDIPHWLQTVISIMVGYIALELVHYFLTSKRVVFAVKQLKEWIRRYRANRQLK
ncbi:MAG: hypothetical protein V4590_00620 [Bacteroidota bacterium]